MGPSHHHHPAKEPCREHLKGCMRRGEVSATQQLRNEWMGTLRVQGRIGSGSGGSSVCAGGGGGGRRRD